LIILIRSKEYQIILNRLAVLLCSFFVAVMISAQPLFIVNEYTPYSTRGGNAINLSEKSDSPKNSGGVSFEYATRWSLHPAEMMALISPRFFDSMCYSIHNFTNESQLYFSDGMQWR